MLFAEEIVYKHNGINISKTTNKHVKNKEISKHISKENQENMKERQGEIRENFQKQPQNK